MSSDTKSTSLDICDESRWYDLTDDKYRLPNTATHRFELGRQSAMTISHMGPLSDQLDRPVAVGRSHSERMMTKMLSTYLV
jgi:hypothetical protein